MTIQKDNKLSDRGGIPVRDYTYPGYREGRKMTKAGQNPQAGTSFDRVARTLGWFSIGLGLVELLLPRNLQRLVGVRANYSGVVRAAGLREIMHGLFIFMQPRPQQGMWSRVAGDALDLAVLGAGFTTPGVKKNRLAVATAMIAGITALDVVTALRINRKRAEERQFSTLTKSDLNHARPGGAFHVSRSIIVNRPPEELYQFWRNFENLPQIMYHLDSVRVLDDRRSHWIVSAPAGMKVEWDAEITEDRPNELIAWRSTASANVPNSGRVHFEPRPAGRAGTIVHVDIEYRPPGGAIGRTIAKLFGKEPSQQIKGDLDRFKQVMETGEVVISEGSPKGTGQKIQHPGRPIAAHEAEQVLPAQVAERWNEQQAPRQAGEQNQPMLH